MSIFDYESRDEAMLPPHKFIGRLTRSALAALLIIALSLLIGVYGYHHYEGMPVVDAFANAAMILSGMGPLSPLTTTPGKLFASFYALSSGIVIVFATTLLLAPLLHRFLHKFHVESDDE